MMIMMMEKSEDVVPKVRRFEDLRFEICTIFVVIVSRPLRELTYAEPGDVELEE